MQVPMQLLYMLLKDVGYKKGPVPYTMFAPIDLAKFKIMCLQQDFDHLTILIDGYGALHIEYLNKSSEYNRAKLNSMMQHQMSNVTYDAMRNTYYQQGDMVSEMVWIYY